MAAAKKGPTGAGKKTFMKGFEESSESEEENRVVESAADKKTKAINTLMADLKNHLKINDFGQIMLDFERLSEEVDRQNAGPTAT